MSERKSRKKNTGASLAILMVITLLMVIVFLVYYPKIKKNIREAKELTESASQTNEAVLPPPPLELDSTEPVQINIADNISEPQKPAEPKAEEPAPVPVKPQTQEPAKEINPVKQETPKTAPKPQQPAPVQVKPATMKTQLCFMTVTSNGKTLRKQTERSVSKDHPLLDSLQALLAGPTAAEKNDGCQSFISSGTKLLGVDIRNGVAVINFSEEFEFNQFGIEGIRCQLQQIVYTATAFPSVKSVQFLIAGEKRQFVNSESSCYIGSPLSRNSF